MIDYNYNRDERYSEGERILQLNGWQHYESYWIACRMNNMNDHHSSFSIFDSENLKMVIQRHLKVFVSLLMYIRRLFITFLFNFKGHIKNRWKLAAFTFILPFITYFIMTYLR